MYLSSKLPQIDDKKEPGAAALADYLENELQRISSSLIEDIRVLELSPSTVAPTRPRTGIIVYADGTFWNPGSGEGAYVYGSDGAWHFLNDIAAAANVTSIAGNTGAFTLNGTSGITNTVNDIKLSPASSSQFGAVKVDGTTIIAASGVISTVNPLPTPIHSSLGADVLLNNTANYFDGPNIAQGTVGTWFVSGTVTCVTTAAADQFFAKLWDGTTVIASGSMASLNGSNAAVIALSGYIVSPAANLRISVRAPATITGNIKFNFTGNSKDSTISAFRIA